MKAHNMNGPRPARAIAACIALGLALAAVMVVLYPALRNQGLAGNRDYEAILGSAPAPGAGARVLQVDALAKDGLVTLSQEEGRYQIAITKAGVLHIRKYNEFYRRIYLEQIRDHYRYRPAPFWLRE